MTPTQIGLEIGKSYNSASAAVTAPLKKLISLGLVEKVGKQYRTKKIVL